MKNYLYIISLMLIFTQSVRSQNLTVASFNLRGDSPNDVGNLWTDRKFMVTSQIVKNSFDVIGLQETNENMVAYLQTQIPSMDSLGVFVNVGTGLLYNADRLLEQGHGYFWLSETPDVESKGWDAKFKRVCVWAKFKDRKNGMDFFVFNTHFDHVGTIARTNSVALVLQRIRSIAGSTPTILLGDFNIAQYDPNYVALCNSNLVKDTKHLALINHEKERGTGNGFNIDRIDRTRVDHIFATQTWKTYTHDVLLDLFNGHTSSDHYCVMAVVGRKENELGELYAQFPEDFENPNPLKTNYTPEDVIFRTGSWRLYATMGGSRSNDQNTSGTYGVRMAGNNTVPAYLQMNFDVNEGVSKVTIEHSTYATDSVSKWQLEYSTNEGLSWTTTGPVITTHQLNKQLAIFILDIPGKVRFRIHKLGISSTKNGRLSIDDFSIYKRKISGEKKNSVQLLAWQFGTPQSTGSESSTSTTLNHPALHPSSLVRGSGFRTTTGNSLNISLTNGFAAGATIASTRYVSDTTIAQNNNLYFEFQVKPKPAHRVSLATINARLMSTGSTLKLWYWTYSLNGKDFTYLAKPYLFNSTSSTSQASVDLSPFPELQDITSDKTVYFRLYVNGANSADDIVGIGPSDALTADDYVLSVGGSAVSTAPKVDTVSMQKKLLAWQFGTPQRSGNEVSIEATTIDSALNATALVRGSGLTTTTLSRAFAALTPIASSINTKDTTVAINNAMFFGFSFTPVQGRIIHLSGIDYKIRASNGGAKVYYWKYSINGTDFFKIEDPQILANTSNSEGEFMPYVDLSEIAALQHIHAGTTVYFRLYTNGSNNSTGSTSIGRSPVGSTTDVLSIVGQTDVEQTTTQSIFLKGNLNERQVNLSWTDGDKSHFEVLRVENGEPVVIGRVSPEELQSQGIDYTYIDAEPKQGVNYYQLRKVSSSGQFSRSPIIAVETTKNDQKFKIAVTDNGLKLFTKAARNEKAEFLLTNMLGQLVIREEIQLIQGHNHQSVSCNLPAGVYIGTLKTNKERMVVKIIAY